MNLIFHMTQQLILLLLIISQISFQVVDLVAFKVNDTFIIFLIRRCHKNVARIWSILDAASRNRFWYWTNWPQIIILSSIQLKPKSLRSKNDYNNSISRQRILEPIYKRETHAGCKWLLRWNYGRLNMRLAFTIADRVAKICTHHHFTNVVNWV